MDLSSTSGHKHLWISDFWKYCQCLSRTDRYVCFMIIKWVAHWQKVMLFLLVIARHAIACGYSRKKVWSVEWSHVISDTLVMVFAEASHRTVVTALADLYNSLVNSAARLIQTLLWWIYTKHFLSLIINWPASIKQKGTFGHFT